VPKLFLAGIVPGLLIGLLVSIYLLVYARIEMIPLTDSLRWKERLGLDPHARVGAVRAGRHLGRHLWRHLHADRGRRNCLRLRHPRSRFIYREMSWLELWQTAIDPPG